MAAGRVAFTFEAGGDPGPAHGILAALREASAKATFFIDGRWAEAHPDLVLAIAAGGHELGNHGYDHPDWTTLSDEEIARDLEATQQLVHELTGGSSKPWARPPYGAVDDRVLAVLGKNGYRAFYRDAVDGAHWPGETTTDSIAERALTAAEQEQVVVFHTNRPETEAVLPELLERLAFGRSELVRLSDLGVAVEPRRARHSDFAGFAVAPGYVRPLAGGGRWHSLNVLELGTADVRSAPSAEQLAALDGASLELLVGSGDAGWKSAAREDDRYVLVLAGEVCWELERDDVALGYLVARAGDLFLWPAGATATLTSVERPPRRWVALLWSGRER